VVRRRAELRSPGDKALPNDTALPGGTCRPVKPGFAHPATMFTSFGGRTTTRLTS
jgi:hypothetical protein